MTNKNYDIKTLQAYLAGKLDTKAMHALEKQALDDPLLQEALDGLVANPDLQAEDLQMGMDRLSARLSGRMAGYGETRKVAHASDEGPYEDADIPVRPLQGHYKRRLWLSAAAIILLLLAGGWFYFSMQGQDKAHDKTIRQAGSEIASAIVDPFNDSSIRSQGGKSPAIAKADLEDNPAETRPQPKTTADKPAEPVRQTAITAGINGTARGATAGAPPAALRPSITHQPAFKAMSAAKARIAAGSIISDTATVLSDVVIAGKQIQIKGAKRLPVVDSLTPVSDEPLFIIDGIPVKNNDQLDYLDRNSIADVKVWKGDSAIARYGSRGVNGVVVVTTKDLAVAPKPGNPKIASVQDMGFPKRKIQSVTQQAVASALSEHVAGAAVTDTGALLQVNIRRVSGHLKPEGGFGILKSYLEKRIAMDIQKGRLTALDTGKVSFEVRLDSTAHRKEVTVKTASSDRLFHWFSQIIGSGPDWNLEKGYKNNDRKTPTEVSVELTRLL